SAMRGSSSRIGLANKKGALASPFVVLRRLGPEARLGPFDDPGERGLLEHREVGENLAVHLDAGLLQARDELAVREARLTATRVDARDPESAELALLVAAVAVGVLPRAHHRFLGDAVYVLAAAAVTLGLLDDLLVARARRDSTFYAGHGGYLGVGKHRLHVPQVGRIDPRGAAQLTLVLGCTLGEDVALARLVALDRAAAADPKALGGATLGLHLGHGCPPSIGAAGGGTLPRFSTCSHLVVLLSASSLAPGS